MKLKNYALGNWIEGQGAGTPLFNAVTGEQIAEATSTGLDFKAMLDYARTVGGPKLRAMTFHERAAMLKALDGPRHPVDDELYAQLHTTHLTS